MPETITERLIALLGFALAVALGVFALGRLGEDKAVRAASAGRPHALAAPAQVQTVVTPARTETVTAPAPARPAAAPAAAPSPAARTRLVVTAARGECWVAVRAGSGDGRTLYQNVLAAGHTIRFSAPRLWVRLGDAANVDLRVNGKAVDTLSQDTLEFLASPRGLVG